MDDRRAVPTDPYEEEVFQHVRDHGWHVQWVFRTEDDEEGPDFFYSIGIYEKTGAPELLTFGFAPEVGHRIVNAYGRRVAAGEKFIPGERYQGFLANDHDVIFLEVTDPRGVDEFATWTHWYYAEQPFPLLQLVFPDTKSRAFPWQKGYRAEWRDLQPLLGEVPNLKA